MRLCLGLTLLCVVVRGGPVEDAADAVLAGKEFDGVDPWLVADELCARGEHDAAAAVAKGPLAAYVESRRGKPADAAARRAVATCQDALDRGDADGALAALSDIAPGDGVTGVRARLLRGHVLGMLRRFEEAPALLGRVAALGPPTLATVQIMPGRRGQTPSARRRRL